MLKQGKSVQKQTKNCLHAGKHRLVIQCARRDETYLTKMLTAVRDKFLLIIFHDLVSV